VRATSFAIEYRDDDNKSQITREDGTVIAYDYDDANRLVEEKWTASDQTVVHHFEYSYDPTGNRLTKTYNGTTTDYDYNSLNQLTQEQTGSDVTEYAYDKDGNTIRKVEPGKTTWYSWNHENMLTRAAFSDATPTNYFGYDVDSVRVEKVDSGGRKQYVRSGLNDLVERSGDTVNRVFIHGMKPLPGVGSLLHVEEGASDLAYHLGPLGNARQLTDSGENVNTDLEFDAFGTRPPGEGDAHTGRGFVSKELDGDTDLWAFPARMYEAESGRFLSRDPVGGSGSLYPYGRSNPAYYTDASGREPMPDQSAYYPPSSSGSAAREHRRPPLRRLTDDEAKLVREALDNIQKTGFSRSYAELNKVFQEGKVKVDPGLPIDVYGETQLDGAIHLNPKRTFEMARVMKPGRRHGLGRMFTAEEMAERMARYRQSATEMRLLAVLHIEQTLIHERVHRHQPGLWKASHPVRREDAPQAAAIQYLTVRLRKCRVQRQRQEIESVMESLPRPQKQAPHLRDRVKDWIRSWPSEIEQLYLAEYWQKGGVPFPR